MTDLYYVEPCVLAHLPMRRFYGLVGGPGLYRASAASTSKLRYFIPGKCRHRWTGGCGDNTHSIHFGCQYLCSVYVKNSRL